MSKKKKCRPCDGQGMLLRIIGGNMVRIPCYHCNGTGKSK
jgi:DnaJ-class molecular chaperone